MALWSSFCSFHDGLDGKESASNVGDLGSIPGSGRSPGEGNGNPLQCSCLENPMDGRAWWDSAHGVAKNRARLSDSPFLFSGAQLGKLWPPWPPFIPAFISSAPGDHWALLGFPFSWLQPGNFLQAVSLENNIYHCFPFSVVTALPCLCPVSFIYFVSCFSVFRQ